MVPQHEVYRRLAVSSFKMRDTILGGCMCIVVIVITTYFFNAHSEREDRILPWLVIFFIIVLLVLARKCHCEGLKDLQISKKEKGESI